MNPDEKAAKMEKHLLKTQFPLECEELPIEALTQEERIVVFKCMDHVELTDDEFTLLKKTLQKYREYITKYRPTETIEAMENTVKIINTEKEFLDILNDESNKMLRVHLTYQGQVYEFNFEILPGKYYAFVVLLLVIYTVLVQSIKKIYIKRNGEWL